MMIRMIIFLVLTVSHRVLSQKRLVENTTCLELAKPSNQQLRLTCSQNNYHCLLDETFTKEFEVCTEWRWILGGKCAYFNTYGSGNIDERNCIQKPNLTCSTVQFSSAANTNHTACYVKKEISTSLPITISPTRTQSVGGTRSVTEISDRGNETTITTIGDKHCQRIFSIFTGIAVFLSIAAILFIRGYMDNLLCKKESQELSDTVRNKKNLEQQPFLRNEVKDTSKSPPTFRHEDENITEKRRSGMNESDSAEHFEDASSSPTTIKQKNSEVSTDEHQKGDNDKFRTNEIESNTSEPAEVDISKGLKEGGTTADKSDYEEGDTQEKTDVFNDTVESLQRIAHPTEKDSTELCTGLYNLLGREGLKLTEEVMAATIRRLTGRSVETLFKDLTDQKENKLKETLSEEFIRIFESKEERKKSVHVLYSLLKFVLEEELCPKSGWGNPVLGKNLGIGDDIERLYRIQTIFREISNPTEISVKGYTRLFDIMYKALIRLDQDVDSKEDFKAVVQKLKQIKNPSPTQIILKQITEISNLLLKTKSNQCCEEEAK